MKSGVWCFFGEAYTVERVRRGRMRCSSDSFTGKWRISMTRTVCIIIDNNKEELVHRKKQVRFRVRGTAVAVLEW